MTKLSFALVGAAALALAACSSGNDDAINADAVNAANEDINVMADSAATDAANAEAVALGTQEEQLELENADTAATPSDDEEQNVAGM